MYFSAQGTGTILRVSTSTVAVTNVYPIPTANSDPEGINPGPGGLWFVEEGKGSGTKIAQLKFS
jgi:streptogramin lyase